MCQIESEFLILPWVRIIHPEPLGEIWYKNQFMAPTIKTKLKNFSWSSSYSDATLDKEKGIELGSYGECIITDLEAPETEGKKANF